MSVLFIPIWLTVICSLTKWSEKDCQELEEFEEDGIIATRPKTGDNEQKKKKKKKKKTKKKQGDAAKENGDDAGTEPESKGEAD